MKLLSIIIIVLVLSMVWSVDSRAKLHTETVEYKHGNTLLKGYLAYDDAIVGKRPGVLVVHEWWGLTDYIKGRTEQLARLGYIAFAIDMYGEGMIAKSPDEAGMLASMYRLDRQLMRSRANAGLEVLRKQGLTDSKRIAAIGYCFGGGTVLELARSGADIAGVVSFHGSLDNPHPEDAHNVKAKILVLHGADDPYVTIEQVTAFWKEMMKTDADWQIHVYSGAVHSFTNPASGNDKTKGVAYDEKADRRSWEDMKLFFSEIFR